MRDGTAYNARNYLFFRVLFHLKNSKKSAQTIHKIPHFGTSGTKVGHGVILGKIAQKVIANMIPHPAGGLASSSEGVFTLL